MRASTRAEVRNQLRQLGVEVATARYDGSGDEGWVEAPGFGLIEVPPDLRTTVEDLFYELLEENYGGWENNEGAFGEFVWDVKSDRIDVVHNSRFEAWNSEARAL